MPSQKLNVVLSQGQSNNPQKRQLEEELVAALLFQKDVEVAIVPHLYDLKPEGTGMLCLQNLTGPLVVLAWLYPRATHWILNRNGISGRLGQTLLTQDSEDEDQPDEDQTGQDQQVGTVDENGSSRWIYCLDLRAASSSEDFLKEIARIKAELSPENFNLMNWIEGQPRQELLQRFLQPTGVEATGVEATGVQAPSLRKADLPEVQEPIRISEITTRRWYPVIDFSRCTNCLECLDFCLFGVYGVDRAENILVEQPDNCKKGCPACSRVCPENAIIFPQHKTPGIAGSPDGAAGGLKIDLSKLFGAPDALEVAVAERDQELVADGREAVGMAVGVPKRQAGKEQQPRDELDDLIDQLDLDL